MILANVNRDEDKRPEPFTLLDFIPKHLHPPRPPQGKPQFDEVGNVAPTNLRVMTPADQRDFLKRMFPARVKTVKRRAAKKRG